MGTNYTIPAEQRAKIAASVKKANADNPELSRAKSQRQRGKPSRGGHTTSHTKRGVSKPETCVFCREEQESGQHG